MEILLFGSTCLEKTGVGVRKQACSKAALLDAYMCEGEAVHEAAFRLGLLLGYQVYDRVIDWRFVQDRQLMNPARHGIL